MRVTRETDVHGSVEKSVLTAGRLTPPLTRCETDSCHPTVGQVSNLSSEVGEMRGSWKRTGFQPVQ
jgi:hypothetical protein